MSATQVSITHTPNPHLHHAPLWARAPDPKVSLDAAGLVALADLTTIAKRTALTGNAALLDIFVIAPGLHRQQAATELNLGEYPAVAALTTGYVFRVENPATVVFLQKISKTGHLTHVEATTWDNKAKFWPRLLSRAFIFQTASLWSTLAYLAALAMTIVAIVLLGLARELWGLGVLSILILARLLNTCIIQRRCQPGWHGKEEPGISGDLLLLMSQDRWVRMKGSVDSLKAVTSGQWLREQTFMESSLSAVATVLVYVDAALASNVSDSGKMILLILLICSAGLLAVANECTKTLYMHGNKVGVVGESKKYERRLDLVKDLLTEDNPDRVEWAMKLGMARLGMTVPSKKSGAPGGSSVQVTM